MLGIALSGAVDEFVGTTVEGAVVVVDMSASWLVGSAVIWCPCVRLSLSIEFSLEEEADEACEVVIDAFIMIELLLLLPPAAPPLLVLSNFFSSSLFRCSSIIIFSLSVSSSPITQSN